MDVHPTFYNLTTVLEVTNSKLLISIDMTDVKEPLAIQIKVDGGDTEEKYYTQNFITEYTVFTIRPKATEEFCRTNKKSCLCDKQKACKADRSYFCKDDRYYLAQIDNYNILHHVLFQYPLEPVIIDMPKYKKVSRQ